MFKRILALLLALACALPLTACGGMDAVFVSTPDSGTAVSLPVAGPDETPASPEEADREETPEAPSPVEKAGPEETPEALSPAEEAGSEETPEVPSPAEEAGLEETPESPAVTEDGWYNSKEEVALYIHLYGHLPDNYITKKEAEELGWTGGSVERCAGKGKAIGGSRFGNYEGLLPDAKGRTWTECDIDTVGTSSRGAKRVVFSNDGLVYYTGDHYGSFELLYGEP